MNRFKNMLKKLEGFKERERVKATPKAWQILRTKTVMLSGLGSLKLWIGKQSKILFLSIILLTLVGAFFFAHKVFAVTPIYFSDVESAQNDGDWNNVLNWWSDSSHTTPAATLPEAGDTVYVDATVTTGPSVAVSLTDLLVAQSSSVNLATADNITVTATATFGLAGTYDSTLTGIITGNAVFYNSSVNNGTVTGNATFNEGSQNNSSVTGNSTFSNTSANTGSGTVGGEAIFNNSSTNSGAVTGTGTFNGDSSEFSAGTITGTRTRYYASSLSTSRNFTGTGAPWTVVADGSGVVVNVVNATYDGGATFNAINGGSFVYQVLGCTDPEADNYAPGANTDDASCTYSAPGLITVISNGTTLVLLYNKNLDIGSVPDTTDFVVTNNASSITVSGVVVRGKEVTLALLSAITSGDTATIDYTAGTNPIQIVHGEDAGDLLGLIIDKTAPTLSTATIDATTLTLTYNEALDTGSTPTTSAFVVNVNGSPVAISTSTISGSRVILSLSNAVGMKDKITINYTLPGNNKIQDIAGNDALDFSGQLVFNITNLSSSYITVGASPVDEAVVIGSKVYVSNTGSNTVSVIDSVNDTVSSTINVGTGPRRLSVVGKYIYVNNFNSSTISVINSDTDTVIATRSNLASYTSFVIGTKVYMSAIGPGKVTVMDANPTSGTFNTIIATTTVGSTPYYSNNVGHLLYVSNGGSGNVSVINTINDGVVTTIPVGSAPRYSSVVGTNIYLTNQSSNNVSVIDANSSSATYNTVIATIPVGTNPVNINRVGKKVYVINNNTNNISVIDADPNSSTFNTVVATISVGSAPVYALPHGSKVYVSNSGSNSISVIDSLSGTVVDTLPVAGGPNFLSMIGNKLYVVCTSGFITVIDAVDDTALNIQAPHLTSITSSSINGTYTTGQSINLTANFNESLGSGSKMRVTLNTGDVVDLTNVSGSTLTGTYIVGSGDNVPDLTVSSIATSSTYTLVKDTDVTPNTNSSFPIHLSPDLTGDTSRNLGDLKNIIINSTHLEISVGTNPYQMVTVGDYTYVANQGSDNVTIFNNTTNAVVATTTVGSQPYGVAYNSTSKEIYVANLKGNSVSVIDADPLSGTFNTVTNTITTGMGVEPYYVASLGTKMYVTNNLSWTVSEINTATHAVTATINVGASPRGIKAIGTKLYVANFGSNYGGLSQGTVSIIDTGNSNAVTTVDVGSGPRGVAVNGTDVYVANFNDNTISRIDTASGNSVTTISVGTNPRGILSLNNKIYVENYQDGTISIIDGTTHAVTGSYKVGNTPSGMTAIGNDVAISRFTDNVVDIFDTTNLVLKTAVVSDTTAPSISSIASSTAQTTATITWTTDESATSTVNYGTTSGYGTASSSSSLVTSHSITLAGLTEGTAYHFQVSSADASGNIATSTDYIFTTTAASDTTAPVISSISSGSPSTSGATITWTTDEAADSQIEYGVSSSYTASTTLNSTLLTSHSVSISGLTANTTYHYRVISKDGSSNTATSSDQTFTTTANTNDSGGSSGGRSGGSSGGGSVTSYVKQPLTPVETATNPVQTIPFFTATLKQGGTGNNQILELQKFLNTHGLPVAKIGAGSLGYETTFFGPATKKALTLFQVTHGIKPSIGIFGPLTKKAINDILAKETSATTITISPVASTTPLCTTSIYLTAPVKYGAKNNPIDVKLLENFLNTYDGTNLPVTGTYSKADYDAVVKFQEKYASTILTPWGLKKGTGYVFTNTLNQIKQIVEASCKK